MAIVNKIDEDKNVKKIVADIPINSNDFPTVYSKCTSDFVSVTGTPTLDQYEYKTGKSGKELVKVGTTNVYEKIQAESDAVDINKLMLRFQNGEVDVFDRVSGAYFDATDIPTSFAEMQHRLIEAEQAFAALDPKVKEAFNNNPFEFFDQYGSDEFISKMSDIYPGEFKEVNIDTSVIDNIPESEVE